MIANVTNLFSDEMRRNPYPLYAQMREHSPAYHVPPPFDAWMLFDYQTVKWALNDHGAFSSRVPAPDWFLFSDPPNHTKLRGLISQAFTPRMVSNLEPRIRELSRGLLDRTTGSGEIDLTVDYAIPLPMMVISEMIGIPSEDWARFNRWSDAIVRISHTRSGGEEAVAASTGYREVTAEMGAYLAERIEQCRVTPKDDLLTRLVAAEVEGERLTPKEILGFFQLLIVGGQETTTNLINNAMLCLMENPDQRKLLESRMELLPQAIEEVLRYRSPLQWMLRAPTRDIEVHGNVIPAGKLTIPVMGSANRDPNVFPQADIFDITRDPNPHVAFGHGIHFCLGAALARLEARVALTDLFERLKNFELATAEPWLPRDAFHVHGPKNLPIRFEPQRRQSAPA